MPQNRAWAFASFALTKRGQLAYFKRETTKAFGLRILLVLRANRVVGATYATCSPDIASEQRPRRIATSVAKATSPQIKSGPSDCAGSDRPARPMIALSLIIAFRHRGKPLQKNASHMPGGEIHHGWALRSARSAAMRNQLSGPSRRIAFLELGLLDLPRTPPSYVEQSFVVPITPRTAVNIFSTGKKYSLEFSAVIQQQAFVGGTGQRLRLSSPRYPAQTP